MANLPTGAFSGLAPGTGEHRPERLLIVDDERAVVDVFVDFFKDQGYDVYTAATGVEALDRIRAEEYDLILTDINLPGADGLEVVRAAKKRNQETGVLVITGHASLNTAIDAIHLGASDFIMKPFDLLAVSRAVERVLGSKRLMEENRRLVSQLTLINEKLAASEESLQLRVAVATRTLRMLFEMSREVSSSLALSTTLSVVTDKCCELLQARACVVLLKREEDGFLMGEGASGADPAVAKALCVQPGVGFMGRGLQGVRGFHFELGAPELESDDNVVLLQARSIAGIRLTGGGETFGLLLAVDREGGFDPGSMDLLALYAGSAGNAIRNAQLFEKTRELDRLKSEFVAVVSHELRTPLTSIRGSLELLSNKKFFEISQQQTELFEICEANADRLLTLINDILDFSKLEANRMTLDVQPVRLADVLRNAGGNMRSLLQKKKLELVLDLPDSPGESDADGHRVGQVVTNLLSNAVKFSSQDKKIFLRLRETPEWAEIEVEDQGEGIDEKDIPKLFQRFQQVDATATRRVGGTGLGLVISRAIVEQHGGTIEVRSRLGAGTTFTFRIPRITVPRAPARDDGMAA